MSHAKQKTSYWNLAIFLLVILIIVAGAYYFWISSEKKSVNTEANENIVVNTNNNKNFNTNIATLKNYKNTSYNFQLDYPFDWSVDKTSTGEGENQIFTVSFGKDNKSVSVSIMSENMEGLVRSSISINNEKKAVINGLEATRLEGGNAKDGSAVSIVLIKMNGKLYSLRGQGSVFEPIVDSFELIN